MISSAANILTVAAAHTEQIKKALEIKWEAIQNASYETGLPGLSLFYAYYARYTGDTQYFEKAEDFLIRGISSLDLANFKRIYKTDSLDAHLAHIGRFLEFTKAHKILEVDTGDYLSDIDSTLLELMQSKIAIGNFDINSGALAAGYYFLGRSEGNVEAPLTLLVQGIENMAFTDEAGDYYWTTPPLYNRIYLGISHGSALLLSFLANVCERGIETEACSRIIRKAACYLLKQRSGYEKGMFPHFIGDEETGPKQFSLCYGDLGIGYALYRAGHVLQDEHLLTVAGSILNDCLTRNREDNRTLDASILYGAAGVGATFEKLHRISGDRRYQQAAGYWYEQIPSYAVHENEFAGYKTRLPDAGPLWNTSFGWGIIGIGISLMRMMKPELPAIDPLLLIA
ncbi:hypothetical protein ECE50_003370 [Chitinophaga sp. Mgbs1]|uniref:Uncharacterized protein n=1 Tax=Chitinophaga solisilvae TaxID=1233460 RepID=A0A3S1CST4_9BACT|nr:hypothetical protein [Chitinophaga solisilvae]